MQEDKKIVFCFQNCSDFCEKRIVLVIDKNFCNSRLKQFLIKNAFLTHSWRFLRSNTLEQLEFTSKK